MTQWIGHGPANQRVAGSIPGQGTCLCCRPDPQLGTCKRQPHIDLSSPLLSPPLSLSLKINKILKKENNGINIKIEEIKLLFA